MSNDFLDFLDDTIIDGCFQPICDKIRTISGWSKRIPSAAMKVVAIIGLFPLCVATVTTGGAWYLFAGLIFFWILINVILMTALIKDEMRDNGPKITKSDNVLDAYRVKGKNDRKIALVLSVFVLPFVLAGISVPELSYEASFYLVGGTANLCDGYFRACTDLPRGKSVFARMREWLRGFARHPLPQTT